MKNLIEKIKESYTLKRIYIDATPVDILEPEFFDEIGELDVTVEKIDGTDLGLLVEQWDNAVLITSRRDDVTFFEGKEHRPALIGYGNEISGGVEMIVEEFDEVDFQFLDRMEKRAHNKPWTIGFTERCILREITLDDLDELFEMYSAPHFTDYMEPLFDRKEEEIYTRNYIDRVYQLYGFGMWIIRDIESGELVGRAGFGFRTLEASGEEVVDIGYAIATEYQRRGIAYEICEYLIKYARDILGFDVMNCFIRPGNTASEKLIQKLDFISCGQVFENGIEFNRYVKRLN